MSAAEAKEVCPHWWMKEALDILIDRLTTSRMQKEEEDVLPCSLF